MPYEAELEDQNVNLPREEFDTREDSDIEETEEDKFELEEEN